MKLNHIKKACMETGRFLIMNDMGGRQWISNSLAAWPVDGVRIGEESIPAIFDLTPKKVDKLTISTMNTVDERFDIHPDQHADTPAEYAGAVWHNGALYHAVKTDAGLMFIDNLHVKPAEKGDGEFILYTREREGGQMVAVFGDMFVSALIAPVSTDRAKLIMGELRKLTFIKLADAGGREEENGFDGDQIEVEENAY